MLYNAKLIDRIGILATDSEEVEREKKASFSMGVTSVPHNDSRIYVIDTPVCRTSMLKLQTEF
jgi:elongation factor G